MEKESKVLKSDSEIFARHFFNFGDNMLHKSFLQRGSTVTDTRPLMPHTTALDCDVTQGIILWYMDISSAHVTYVIDPLVFPDQHVLMSSETAWATNNLKLSAG